MRYCLLFLLWLINLPTWGLSPIGIDGAIKTSITLLSPHQLIIDFSLKPGVNLYKRSIEVYLKPTTAAHIKHVSYPSYNKEILGPEGTPTPVYTNKVAIGVTLTNLNRDEFTLYLRYRGCQDHSVCYPPQHQKYTLNLSPPYNQPITGLKVEPPDSTTPHTKNNERATVTIVGYFLIGLLMAFSPCVLPMLPIVLALIVGRTRMNRTQGLALTSAYVLGMALAYALAGVLVSLLGSEFTALMHQPVILFLFAGLIAAMSLSLFGFFDIELPRAIQRRLHSINQTKQHGRLLSAFLLGAGATVLLSPCITPALVGVLTYIAHSHEWIKGGTSLFIMGLGMGTPLLLIAWVGDSVFRRHNHLVALAKKLLGCILLALALQLISTSLSSWAIQSLWGIFFIGSAILIEKHVKLNKIHLKFIARIIPLLLLIYGAACLSQLWIGTTNKSFIVDFDTKKSQKREAVDSLEDLSLKLMQHPTQLQILWVTADWCRNCQQFSKELETNEQLQQALKNSRILILDITQATKPKSMITDKFRVYGAPTLIFFKNKKEINRTRIIGEINIKDLIKSIHRSTRGEESLIMR